MARDLDVHTLLAHSRFLRGLARDLLHDEHLAEDVVQETWLRAMRTGPSKPNSMRAWLATVTRNLARDRGRAERARRLREQHVAKAEAVQPTDRLEAQRRVAAYVAQLGPPYRDVLILRYLDDLSVAEIAQRLGAPSATIRTRMHRGLAMLRARMDADHGGDRRAWALFVLPLASARRGPGALALLGGVLVQKLKIATVAAVVLVALGVALLNTDDPKRATRRKSAAHAPSLPKGEAKLPDNRETKTAVNRSLAGRVIDADGRPVPGAQVEARRVDPRRWYEPHSRRVVRPQAVVSDEHGRFRLQLGHHDAVSLRAKHELGATMRTVRAGTNDCGAMELRLDATGTVVLRVVNETGAPVQGAQVHIGPRLYSDDGSGSRLFHTDRDGRVTGYGIPVNPWGHGVTVRYPGYATAAFVAAMVPNADWTIRLVRATTVASAVVDARGQPVPNARIRWVCERARHFSGEIYADRTGRFSIVDFPPHPCMLFVDGGQRGQTCVRFNTAPYPTRVTLDEIKLRSGVVVDTNDKPVAGVQVAGFQKDMVLIRTSFSNGLSNRGFYKLARFAVTDAAGRFSFPGLSIHANHIAVSRKEPFRTVRTLDHGGSLTIVVERAPLRHGRVVDPSGAAVSDARVIRPGGADYERYTDEEGRFSFREVPNKDGFQKEMELEATKAGYAKTTLRTADRTPVVVLAPVGPTRGRIVDPDGNPIVGARVGADRRYAFSGTDGRFRLWLAAGSHSYSIQRDGFDSHSATVPATGAALDLGEITLTPRATASLRGQVTNAAGQPLAGTVVEVKSAGPWRRDHQERTDRFGRFEFPMLYAGPATMRIACGSYAVVRTTLELAGDVVLPTIVLDRGYRVVGTVVDHTGATVSGAKVTAASTDGDDRDRLTTETDRNGRFEFGELNGRFRVFAAVTTKGACQAWVRTEIDDRAGALVLRLAAPTFVRGRLLDPNGAPLTGIGVEAEITDVAFRNSPLDRPTGRATTDKRGRFEIRKLWGRRCRIEFSRHVTPAGTVLALLPRTDVETGIEQTFQFHEGESLEGRVLAPSGQPAAHASISLLDGELNAVELRADARGRFFIRGLARSSYRISAHAHFISMGKNVGIRQPAWTAQQRPAKPSTKPITIQLIETEPVLPGR